MYRCRKCDNCKKLDKAGNICFRASIAGYGEDAAIVWNDILKAWPCTATDPNGKDDRILMKKLPD